MKPYIALFAIILCFLTLGILINGALFIFVFKPYIYGYQRSNQPKPQNAAHNYIIPESSSTAQPTNNGYPSDIISSKISVITLRPSSDVTQSLSRTLSPSPYADLFTKTLIFHSSFTPTLTTKSTNTPKATKTMFSATPKPSQTSTITPSPTPLPFNGSLLISEIMINPLGDQPQNEWIEISNPNASAVDLTYFKIGDEETPLQSEGMYLFPFGTVIQPNEVFVIANQAKAFQRVYGFLPNAEFENTNPNVPCMIPFTSWASGVINLNNGGDEVILMDGANQTLDAVSWGNSPNYISLSKLGIKSGTSLERYPTFFTAFSIDSWRTQTEPNPGKIALNPTLTPTVITLTPTPTFTSTNTPTPTKEYTAVPNIKLIITEIYFPIMGPMYSWVKICNPHSVLYASLDEMKLGDNLSLDNTEVIYEFPIHSELMPNHCLIVAYQAEKFRSLYHQNPDYELLDTDNTVNNLNLVNGYTNNVFYLDPAGDELLLLDSGYFQVDGIGWGNSIYEKKLNFPIVSGASIKRDKNNLENWIIDYNPTPTNNLSYEQ